MDDTILTSLLDHAAHSHKTSAEDLVLEDVREVRDPSSVLPPLDHPGLHTGLFEALYTANEANTELNVFLPQTVVFAFGRPTAWYSTQVVGTGATKKFVIRKRRVTALKTTLILRSFLADGALLDDADPRLIGAAERRREAVVPSVAVKSAPEGSNSNPAIIALFISARHGIRYLDHALLKHLVLLAPSDERDGVLQQCVAPPSGRYHRRAEGLRVLWTPHVCLVDRRRNCVPETRSSVKRPTPAATVGASGTAGSVTPPAASSKALPLADAATMFRAETFDGSSYATAEDWPVRSAAQVATLRLQASAVADHYTSVSGGQYVIDAMTLAMRVTRTGDVVLQWAEAVSVSEVVPLPPPPPSATPAALSLRRGDEDDAMGQLLRERAPTFMRRRSTAPTAAAIMRKQSTQFFDAPMSLEASMAVRPPILEDVPVDPVLVFERSRLRHLPSVKTYIGRKVLALARANSSKRSIGSFGGVKMSSASVGSPSQHNDNADVQHEMPVLRFCLKKLTKFVSDSPEKSSPVADDGDGVDGGSPSKRPPTSAQRPSTRSQHPNSGQLVHSLAAARAEVFTCEYCQREGLPLSSQTRVTYGAMLEAADGASARRRRPLQQRPSSPSSPPSAGRQEAVSPQRRKQPETPPPSHQQSNVPPFTESSFVLQFDKPPSWSRRVGDPPIVKPTLADADRDPRMPAFLRRLRPLMRYEDLCVYADRADFRSSESRCCVDCALELTGGLALPTEAELRQRSFQHRDDGAHAVGSPSRSERDVTTTSVQQSGAALSPVAYRDIRPPSRALLPRSRQATPVANSPLPLASSQKSAVPARSSTPAAAVPRARPPLPQLSASSTSTTKGTTGGSGAAAASSFWNRLSMPSTFLGRPQSVELVERIRAESRLYGRAAEMPSAGSRHQGYASSVTPDPNANASSGDAGASFNEEGGAERHTYAKEDVSW